ncbi:hypothetical protein [Erwinia amylovora]
MCIRDRRDTVLRQIVWGSTETVSYTHLDVYKRQAALRVDAPS